jgi:Predicted nucleotide-binding protein containing TIR-like domain/YheO-like PAS domain
MRKPTCFIGCSSPAKDVAYALQGLMSKVCDVEVWDQGIFEVGGNQLDALLAAPDRFDFAILIFTGDDKLKTPKGVFNAPRDNVIFELGLFLSKLGKDRTFIVYEEGTDVKIPTDLQGIIYAGYNMQSSGKHTPSVAPAWNKISSKIHHIGPKPDNARIEGKRLFQYPDLYPIYYDKKANKPEVDQKKFVKCIEHLLHDRNYDKLAAFDLAYLREDNVIFRTDLCPPNHKKKYDELVAKYNLNEPIAMIEADKKSFFNNYIQIVHDLGKLFRGINAEIILHNIMNPLRSMIAVANTDEVSRRSASGPITEFAVNFILHQGLRTERPKEGGSYCSYHKILDGKIDVKAATIPIYHNRFGLIGILCINISIGAIKKFTSAKKNELIANYVKLTGEQPPF